jgi:hypothetical protein
LLVQPSNIRILLRRLLLQFHRFDSRVVLCWQLLKQDVGVLVDTHQFSGFEVCTVHQARDRQEDGVSGTSLDNHAFVLRFLIGVLIAVFLWFDIEYLYNVRDKPG